MNARINILTKRGYSGQQQVERVFRGLKERDWLGWGPMYHWTDQKIPVHAFYCMLGISLLQYIYKKAQTAWAVDGTVARRTSPDPTVRAALSSSK